MPPNSRPALPAVGGPVLNDIRDRIAFLAARAEACDGSLPFVPNGCVPRDAPMILRVIICWSRLVAIPFEQPNSYHQNASRSNQNQWQTN